MERFQQHYTENLTNSGITHDIYFIQRDSGVDRVVCWLDEVRENPDSFHLSVQPPGSLSVVFPHDPNMAAELWTAVFSPPYPKSERKLAETQRTTSHVMLL